MTHIARDYGRNVVLPAEYARRRRLFRQLLAERTFFDMLNLGMGLLYHSNSSGALFDLYAPQLHGVL
jgi:hypothetical protein